MNLVYSMSELAADFVEAWLCYHFVSLFLGKPANKKGGFLLLSIVLIAFLQGMKALDIEPLITTLWFVFFVCITTAVFFQVDAFYAVSLVSFYILCVYIIDFFCMSAIGVLGDNIQFARLVMSQLSLWRVFYLAVNKALLLLFYLLSRWVLKRKLLYSPGLLFAVSFLGLSGAGFLSWLTIKETNVHALFSWSMCLVMLSLFYLLLRFYTDYRGERELRELRELREQIVQQEYEGLKDQQRERELSDHDMKNHLLVLHSLIEGQRIKEAKSYLERISRPFLERSDLIWTGNETLDLLINQVRRRAKQKGVSFTIETDAVPLGHMEEEDVCSLFANLLDNAYEAAAEMEAGQGWIRLKIRRAREMLFVELENSMAEPPRKKAGGLLSSKKDSRLHGLGLLSARRIVSKYGGHLEYDWQKGIFVITVTFLGQVM